MSDNGRLNVAWLKVKLLENAAGLSPNVGNPKKLRSKMSNGSKLLPLTDGRSATARRFKDLVGDISADLGGVAMLSEGQRQLIRRAAMLSAECERQEALSARGEAEFNVELYGTMCDRRGRLFGRLGLARVMRDTTPTLSDYLAAKAEP